jgi:AraC-like DNA-binding protein
MDKQNSERTVIRRASRPKTRPVLGVALTPEKATDGVLRQQRLQRVARRVFEELPVAPIARALGIAIQPIWAPALPLAWRPEDILRLFRSVPEVCAESSARAAKDALCEECVRRELSATLNAGARGREFTCQHGRRQFWMAIHAANATLGILLCSELHPPRALAGAGLSDEGTGVVAGRTGGRDQDDLEPGRSLVVMLSRLLEAACAEHLRSLELEGWQQVALTAGAGADRGTGEAALPPETAMPANSTIRALLERTHREFAQPITLKSLAHDLSKNESYLSAAFSACVGMNFKAYLTSLRIRQATVLLARGQASVEEIARACGYLDPRRFSRVFKQQTGVNPQAFRRGAGGLGAAERQLEMTRLRP